MTVHSYTSNINKESGSEFDDCINESEKILMESFRRVVIKGKRGRGVPALFTEEMLKTTDLLLEVRANFVQDTNIHLFANTKSSSSINGSKAVYTHVRRAGARNAAALTSTKLRKHLATMSQVINLSEQDLEQLWAIPPIYTKAATDYQTTCFKWRRFQNYLYLMRGEKHLNIKEKRWTKSKLI
ncbi:hypothetical protein JTB14_023071 [Gonioctena quinquepunctata]|nr:hypothetical protein JTB14_023071 [Gonioctena quinquepunctata]